MTKLAIATLTAFGVFALPAAAHAQSNDSEGAEPYVGVSVGYHDLGTGIPDDDGIVYGVVAGVDVPVGETLFVGAEGNFHLGENAIDSEYGIAARVGARIGEASKVFVRGGYQEVDIALGNFITPAVVGLDDTDGDYLVGAGIDFGLSEDSPVRFRAAIDTIAFDSTRATVGVLFAF